MQKRNPVIPTIREGEGELGKHKKYAKNKIVQVLVCILSQKANGRSPNILFVASLCILYKKNPPIRVGFCNYLVNRIACEPSCITRDHL